MREEVSVRLTPQQSPPNRILEVIPAARIERRDDGAIRVELAKMFNGHLDLRLQGRPGAEVVVDVSDRPEVDQVYNQQHRFVVGPAGHARFRNRFNYTTGQWLTIRGEVEVPRPEDVRGLLIATDLGPPARFECDLPHVEQLYETALHTLRCLSLGGYVVDCSHRERLGYGGDGQGALQLLLPTLDGRALLAKWLEDWVDVQQPDGNLPFTAPTYGGGGGPMWSGFIVHGAAEMHERHGDLAPAAHAYPAIARWLEFLQTHVRDGLLQRHAGPADFISARWSFLGDWVAPGRQQGPNGDDPETHFLNNAYYVWTLNRAGNLAAALGHDDDAERWRQEARDVARATHDAYWRPEEQTYSDGRQPSLALALVAQLPPPALRDVVVKRLVEQITDACGGHLDTGISGTQFLLRALQQIERADLGLLMIGQRDQPGWRYMLDQNATALWEQWDGGHSRCHASFLGVGGWVIESLVGGQGGRPTASDGGDSCWTIVPSFAEGADFA
ncbi:MAG TPA: hypothetical protein PKC18_19415, partial [Lacipirellulaceae bacterium]|nr:hypothetical protein [Lacipirellulaceae bacterium]